MRKPPATRHMTTIFDILQMREARAFGMLLLKTSLVEMYIVRDTSERKHDIMNRRNCVLHLILWLSLFNATERKVVHRVYI